MQNSAPIEIKTFEKTQIKEPPSADKVRDNLDKNKNLLGETTRSVLEKDKDGASLLRAYQDYQEQEKINEIQKQ